MRGNSLRCIAVSSFNHLQDRIVAVTVDDRLDKCEQQHLKSRPQAQWLVAGTYLTPHTLVLFIFTLPLFLLLPFVTVNMFTKWSLC